MGRNLWEILDEGIRFSCPLPFVFLVSPFLPLPWPSALRNSTPLYPAHLTPQNLPFGRTCIFYQTSRAGIGPWILHLNPELLTVGFLKDSREEWLHWNATALRASGDPGRRSWIPLLPRHQPSHFLTAAGSAHDPVPGNMQSSHASVTQSSQATY